MGRRATGAARRPARWPWLATALWACGCAGRPEPGAAAPEELPAVRDDAGSAREARGAELFATHCAVCHGARGAGDGPAYPWLFPRARDFTSGRFRLVGTDRGAPSDEDLIRTLRRGVPGSAMPAWDWLPESDLEDLAWYVRELAVAGLARRLRGRARAVGDGFAMRAAGREARERMEPGRVLPPLASLPDDPAALARGRQLFVRDCAGCHGVDGTGDEHPRLAEDGSLVWPRDFTAGFMKGGATPTDLAWRVRAGIPGTPMPAFGLEGAELEALVAYVGSLIPPGSQDRLVQRRRTLVARRAERLPVDPADAAWERAGWTEVVLAPLRWNPRAVLGAELAAFHDGRQIALALRWNDPTGELLDLSDLVRPDGAALQLSAGAAPPLFGMGSLEHPTTIWHWRAVRASDQGGTLDLLEHPPHALGEPFTGAARPDVPVYDRAALLPEAAGEADELTAVGVGDVSGSGGEVAVEPRWFDGRWTVVFVRDLVPPTEPLGGGQVALEAGRPVQLAVAVWNGAAGDQRGQKSISIWHALELE